MPLTFTDAERAAIAGSQLDCYCVFEAQNPDGDFVNFSVDLDTPDWLNGVTLHDDIDANAMSMSAELLRDDVINGLSLAPLLESSTINRNGVDAYAPMLDLVRMWRVSVCVLPHGDPVPTFPDDYHEIGKGYIDSIQVDDINPTIQVAGRGEEAAIIDTEILEVRTYSVGTTDDMETVIQALLDDNMANPPTLFVPTPTAVIINEYNQATGNLMQAITAVAQLFGYICRYMYDPTDNVNKLTLLLPNREAADGDEVWETDAFEYLRLPRNLLDISGVRNLAVVKFFSDALGVADIVQSPTSGTSASITSYGKRVISIDLSADTQIVTQDRAQALADAVAADLEFPRLQQEVELFGFWPVQLTDWGKIIANGVMY